MAYIFDFATPTTRDKYFLFPALGAGLGAAGAAALWVAYGLPMQVIGFAAFGWACAAAVPTTIVTIYSVGNERSTFNERQKEVQAHQPYPELPRFEQVAEVATPPERTESKNGFIKVAVTDEDTGTGADIFDPDWSMWWMARHGGYDPKKSLSDDEWTGRGKPFSKKEFHVLRDWMMTENLARWINVRAHSQGWEIRPRVRAIMRGLSVIEEWNGPPLPRGA